MLHFKYGTYKLCGVVLPSLVVRDGNLSAAVLHGDVEQVMGEVVVHTHELQQSVSSKSLGNAAVGELKELLSID